MRVPASSRSVDQYARGRLARAALDLAPDVVAISDELDDVELRRAGADDFVVHLHDEDDAFVAALDRGEVAGVS